MRKRGRKSAAELAAKPVEDKDGQYPEAPMTLSKDGRKLWDRVMRDRPTGFFSSGDLPLLQEYCHNCSTLLPAINKNIEADMSSLMLNARDKLVRQTATLAGKLRICVSSRTRADTASMRDSIADKPVPWRTLADIH